jgi:GNAT superfamily N-acetyltransferase
MPHHRHDHDGRAARTFLVRDWTAADVHAVQDAARHIAPEQLYNRFLTGTSTLPRPYLRHVRDAWPTRWDAVVAVTTEAHTGSEQVIGWAEAGRARHVTGPTCTAGAHGPAAWNGREWAAADIAIVVVDHWQRRGVGTALIDTLVARCQQRPVLRLTADILASNVAAHRLAARYLTGDRGRRVRAHTWDRVVGGPLWRGTVDCLAVDLARVEAA